MAIDESNLDYGPHWALRDELIAGLRQPDRAINPKFFYDETGSELFARICDLPEYYPTRTEIGIFQAHSAAIAAATGDNRLVIEPGAGSCEKIRYLLDDLQPSTYVPVDISEQHLLAATADLAQEFPQLQVVPVAADFSDDFDIPQLDAGDPAVVFYPGSTIGNFTPSAAQQFLGKIATALGTGGGLLIGTDLHKDAAVLTAAYNDAQGVTAAFNRNILSHANSLLDANFQPQQFAHNAFYNENERRIEMHLVSRQAQQVRYGNEVLNFVEGDSIHTEYSYKYSAEDFAQLAARAGFELRERWHDPRDWFSVQYFEVGENSWGA